MKKFNILGIASILLFTASCSDDFLDKEARDTVSKDQLQDLANSSPEAALTLSTGLEGGTYFFMNDFATSNQGNLHDDFGHMAFNLGLDLMSNDMYLTSSNWFVQYYSYTARNQTSTRTNMIWRHYYKIIQNVTEILVFIPLDTDNADLLAVRGRGLALRAFAYFQLHRIYSDGTVSVPLTTDTELLAPRQPDEVIEEQILSDLTEAYDLLEGYQRPNKTVINQNVVAGFLARYYLEYGNWAQAASFAAEARQGFAPMSSTDLFDGFNKITNGEWMWGADINTNTTTYYASYFSNIGNLNPGYAGLLESYKSIDRRLYDAIGPDDLRLAWFDGPAFGLPQYANTKFIDDTDFEGDYVFMRGAEMYLIEAEAKAAGGDDAGARTVLSELLSSRMASGTFTSVNTGTVLMNEIRTHRRIELWGEGFAFFDMKRWNIGLTRDYPGTNHNSLGLFNYPAGSPKFVFQIPISEVNNNPELGAQNPL